MQQQERYREKVPFVIAMERSRYNGELHSLQLPEETAQLLTKIEESQFGFREDLQGPYGPRRSKYFSANFAGFRPIDLLNPPKNQCCGNCGNCIAGLFVFCSGVRRLYCVGQISQLRRGLHSESRAPYLRQYTHYHHGHWQDHYSTKRGSQVCAQYVVKVKF